MGAKLYIQPSRAEPFEVAIGNTATIGRTRENTVCLNFSPLVSRQHAVIRCHNGWQYQLIDLGSRNGTFVNEQRVVMPVTLDQGARIRIADNVITFFEPLEIRGEEHGEITVAETTISAGFEARPVALLVCDIRGFSAISERVGSSDLAQLLGAWFREAGNLVTKMGGTIDKFLGDALLAYWGTSPDGVLDCSAALETAQRLLQLAEEQRWPGGKPFRIAVALHHGKVTCTNVGIAAERDATIIGDAVNTVFRLEEASKQIGQTVLLSGDFAGHLPEAAGLEDLGERQLKGKSRTVRLFGLRAMH